MYANPLRSPDRRSGASRSVWSLRRGRPSWRAPGTRLLSALWAAGLVAGLAGLTASCTSTGDISNPLVRKATWFSYLNGDDLRAACVPGAPDRLRLVHNADYMQRVRVAELGPADPGAGGAAGPWRLTTRVLGGGLASITLDPDDPFRALAPFSGTVTRVTLDAATAARLLSALRQDGLGGPVPARRELLSWWFWWLAVGCLEGRPVFQAWAERWGDEGGAEDRAHRPYAALRFPALLTAVDGTGVPLLTPAMAPPPVAPPAVNPQAIRHEVRFRLALDRDGIRG